MVATSSPLSPFTACLSPHHSDVDPFLNASANHSKSRSNNNNVGIRPPRPPRPHTTTSASTSTSFFRSPSHASSSLWDDLRELGLDVKDGISGLKEVWMDNSTKGTTKCSFMEDISEFVEPTLDSLGIGEIMDGSYSKDRRRERGMDSRLNQSMLSTSLEEEDSPKFFTFDKMERLLNYCVPLAVDPRSPKTRARDKGDGTSLSGESDLVAASSLESRMIKSDEESLCISAASAAHSAGHQSHHLSAQKSHDTLSLWTEGLKEHTNRLREQLMDRSRGRAQTTPARMLESRMELQGRNSGISSEESKVNGPPERGLWSLSSYGESHSYDSRSMEHSRSGSSEERGHASVSSRKYRDDVMLTRSVSGDNTIVTGSHGSMRSRLSEEERKHDFVAGIIESAYREAEASLHLEKHHEGDGVKRRNLGLHLDTSVEDGRDDDDMDMVVHAAAMKAVTGLISPRSVGSEDKYNLGEEDEEDDEREDMNREGRSHVVHNVYAETPALSFYGQEARQQDHAPERHEASREERSNVQDPYADIHELSHHHQDARQKVLSMYPEEEAIDTRDDENEATNRHFDNIISDFELSINRQDEKDDDEQSKNSVYNKLRKYQQKKNSSKNRGKNRNKTASPRASKIKSPRSTTRNNVDDDVSRTSYTTNHSTAFLQGTTMGRKLNRSVTSSPGGGVGLNHGVPASPGDTSGDLRESVIDRARHAVTRVHEVIESLSEDDAEEVKGSEGSKGIGSDGGVRAIRTKTNGTERNRKQTPRTGASETSSRTARSASSTPNSNELKMEDSSPISVYKKRLLEERERRRQRELASQGEEDAEDVSSHSRRVQPEYVGRERERDVKHNAPPTQHKPTLSEHIQRDLVSQGKGSEGKEPPHQTHNASPAQQKPTLSGHIQRDLASQGNQGNAHFSESVAVQVSKSGDNSEHSKSIEQRGSTESWQKSTSSQHNQGDVATSEEAGRNMSVKSPASTNKLDRLLQRSIPEEATLDGSGANSFDSSVNWDALAYSMSGSVSMAEWSASQQHKTDTVDHHETAGYMQEWREQFQYSTDVIHENKPLVMAASPKNHYPVMERIQQIRKQHDEKMARIRVLNPETIDETVDESVYNEAPDDEDRDTTWVNSASEEENKPISPNLSVASNKYGQALAKSSKSVMQSAVQKRIEAMRHNASVKYNQKYQLEKESDMMLDQVKSEQRIDGSEELWKSNSSRSGQFNVTTPVSSRRKSNRFSFDSPSKGTPKKLSTQDLMLSNLKLEEEMEQIKALSPKSSDSWPSPRSPRSPKKYGNEEPVSSLLQHSTSSKSKFLGTIKSNREALTSPSHSRSNESKCILKVEIPTSPISTPHRTSQSTIPASPITPKPIFSPQHDQVRTRVSDLMEEVKGFLAENDRARERIARDMDAM